jgi:hypothetical protein
VIRRGELFDAPGEVAFVLPEGYAAGVDDVRGIDLPGDSANRDDGVTRARVVGANDDLVGPLERCERGRSDGRSYCRVIRSELAHATEQRAVQKVASNLGGAHDDEELRLGRERILQSWGSFASADVRNAP